MNEEPKRIWKKSWPGPPWLFPWLLTVVATFIIILVIQLLLSDAPRRISDWAVILAVSAVMATFFLGLVAFIRWLRSWRNFVRFLFGLACFATLIALFYAVEDWRGRHEWLRFKQHWQARGEAFDMAGIAPAPVPDDQNFALTPIAFSSYGNLFTRDGKLIPNDQRPTNFVVRLSLPISENEDPTNAAGDRIRGRFTNLQAWQNYYRALAASTNEFPVPPQPGAPAADVLFALAKYDSALDELRAASRLPDSRFPLTYDSESPETIMLPHLAALKTCARLLQLRSAAELQNGQPEKALADVSLGFQLADKIRTEPFIISHLVRLAMTHLMLQSLWEGLAEHQWSDAQLAALDMALAKFDFAADYQRGIRGENACITTEIERVRRHPNLLPDLGDYTEDAGKKSILSGSSFAELIPSGWFYQSQYRCARVMLEYYLPVADVEQHRFLPDLGSRGDALVVAETKSAGPGNLLERIMLPSLGKAGQRFAYEQASVDSARTAIALERYHLAHGEFPESLAALVPQFLPAVPPDVIGGQPLKYRRLAGDRFLVYSIGWDETDDGGVSVFAKASSPQLDRSQGDWVWQNLP